MKFSANLGFMWADLALPDAIRAAKMEGFDAVECHWPYAFDPAEVRAALTETGLEMLSLNTSRGGIRRRAKTACRLCPRGRMMPALRLIRRSGLTRRSGHRTSS